MSDIQESENRQSGERKKKRLRTIRLNDDEYERISQIKAGFSASVMDLYRNWLRMNQAKKKLETRILQQKSSLFPLLRLYLKAKHEASAGAHAHANDQQKKTLATMREELFGMSAEIELVLELLQELEGPVQLSLYFSEQEIFYLKELWKQKQKLHEVQEELKVLEAERRKEREREGV